MTENLENKSDSENQTIRVKDFFLSQEEFELKRNQSFGFLETIPQPMNLGKYYESENYISHSDSKRTIFDKIYQFIKNYNITYKLNLLPKNSKNLLDYGCGTGEFLVHAQKRNFDVLGQEPNLQALKIAQEKLGKNRVSSTDIFSISEKFDCITLWHVLEHIPEIEKFIPELISKLKVGGKLFIAVPNHTSFDAKYYGEFWAAYDVPRHLWHFSPNSMNRLFSHFGMKIEKTYPLWFDSYYVSLLSEKYKNPKNPLGWVRALLIGTLSNLKGIFSGNYSSVIYQISKK
jgi:SAM-dependent methyltransferase